MYTVFVAFTEFAGDQCNLPLFRRELADAFDGTAYTLIDINDLTDSGGIKILTPDYGIPAIEAAIDAIIVDVVTAHDYTLKTTEQLIEIQAEAAQASARDTFYTNRDKTAVAMIAIAIAQRFNDLEGDSNTFTTQGQAITYFTNKMIEHATLVDSSDTSGAGALMSNAFRSVLVTLIDAAEYKSNGSED